MSDDDTILRGDDDTEAVTDVDSAVELCEDREQLAPHETADCAGADLAEQYDNEEDGGS